MVKNLVTGEWGLPGGDIPAGESIPEVGARFLELQAGLELYLARLLAFDQTTAEDGEEILTAVLDGGFLGPEKTRIHNRLSRTIGTLLPMKWITMASVAKDGDPGYMNHAIVSRLMGNLTAPVLVNGRNDMERRESPEG
ncbi:hypothetical protein OHT52_16230 [Streptomyces sp. NBC_00247]|uniref:hypothetical protein n=1 Tax=Streptomyces sp. NBC_00247 TaxID=2975689 RepID=UPI002E2BD31C|nr:hypothetical protein [Streptomyces sp. NBC_00247]